MAGLKLTLNVNDFSREGSKIILVVDDFREVREGLSVVLNKHGYQTVEASNAHEAKLMYETLPIEFVVTDIYMAGKDGLHLIAELREKGRLLEEESKKIESTMSHFQKELAEIERRAKKICRLSNWNYVLISRQDRETSNS